MAKILVLIVLILSIAACHDTVSNNTDNLVPATITGPDLTMTPCSGGWFIKIDTVTYRLIDLPQESNINLDSAKFPLDVYISWMKDTTTGLCRNMGWIHAIKMLKR